MLVARVSLLLADSLNNHGAIFASVGNDSLHRFGQGFANGVNTDLGIILVHLEVFECAHCIHQGDTTAWNNTFLNSSAGCRQGVFHTMFLFFQFGLSCSADTDDSHTASQFSQAFLQFFAIVIAGCVLDFSADLLNAALDGIGITLTADDGGAVFVDGDFFSATEVFDGGVFEFAAGLFRDHGSIGQDSDILEHGLAAITKARGFDSDDIQDAADLVQNQGCDCFAVNIFSDDDDIALANLHHFFQQGNDIVGCRDFLVIDQDIGVVNFGDHVFGIGDEIGADIAAVKLHTFHVFGLEFECFGFFHGDDAVFADFVHHVCDQGANLLVLG